MVRLRWIREVGLMDKIHGQFISKKPKCEGNARSFVSVGLHGIQPAIMLFVVGSLIAFIILGHEILYKKFIDEQALFKLIWNKFKWQI